MTVSHVPLSSICFRHMRAFSHEVDGTERRLCVGCIADEVRMAEAVLHVDREYHRHHDVKQPGCPFCFPGAVA